MIEQKVRQALNKKINKKDKILVAVSGGKDSAVTCYLLKKFGYNIEAIHIDLKMGEYSEKCLKSTQELCRQLGINLYVYDIRKEMGNSMCNIRQSVQSKSENNIKNCAICGVIKKWILNREARRLKAKYIATGHHLDDESQTFLLNILKGSPELSANSEIISRNIADTENQRFSVHQTSKNKQEVRCKKFIPRIKPLFFVLEKDIKEYSIVNKLPVVYEKCPCAIDSYRIQIREFMKTLTDKQKRNLMKNAEECLKKIKTKKSECIIARSAESLQETEYAKCAN